MSQGIRIVMERHGTFQCTWRDANGKCGTGDSLNPVYAYTCRIEADPVLDDNDFLIDQLDIDRYFQDRYKVNDGIKAYHPGFTPRSCERIALNAINDLKNHLSSHVGQNYIHKIAVTITVDGSAKLTAEWIPPKKRKTKLVNYIEWSEPYFQGLPVYCHVTEETAITIQKFAAQQAKPGFEYSSDEAALDDFITVHWANKIQIEETI